MHREPPRNDKLGVACTCQATGRSRVTLKNSLPHLYRYGSAGVTLDLGRVLQAERERAEAERQRAGTLM